MEPFPRPSTFDAFGDPIAERACEVEAGTRGSRSTIAAVIAFWVVALLLLVGRASLPLDHAGHDADAGASLVRSVASVSTSG